MWHILLMFAFAHMTHYGMIPCRDLKCVHKVEWVARHDPQITGFKVFAPGDGEDYFSHWMPLILNERKA